MAGPNAQRVVDLLKRALQMEEEMSGHLLELCQPDRLPETLPENVRQQLRAGLLSIREDTQRHRRTVSALLERFAGSRP